MTDLLKKILSYAAYLPVHQPWFFLLPLILGTIFFAYHLPSFSLDSTTDSLIIKNDAEFNFYNETRANFTSDDYVIISFEDENILSRENIGMVSELCTTIKNDVKYVKSVESIATMPLFNSPPLRFKNPMLNSIEEKFRKQAKDGQTDKTPITLPKSVLRMLENIMGKVFEDEIDNLKTMIENPPTLGNVEERADRDLKSEGIDENFENFATMKNQRIAEYYRLGCLELVNHPIYSNNLISKDLTATSIVVQVPLDPILVEVEKRKAELKILLEKAKREDTLNVDKIKDDFDSASVEFLKYHDAFSVRRSNRLGKIYEVLEIFSVKTGKTFYLGGVPVIVKKMVSNLEHDIIFFGIGIVALLSIILFAVFFRFRWMLIPMVTCIIVAIWVIGAMAFNNDRGNIITANAITIVFVIAMAHSIHLIIKYREFQNNHPEMSNKEQLKNTLRIMAIPCFYTALTTAAGFASFLITNIEPIITFGIYMCLGVFLALLVSFVAFPVGVMLLGPSRPPKRVEEYR
ncbi:MAG: MMPL family transporter, partial [Planctomycetes bacterium]|nr:MMPL family transporter [Planctomycetota bacterium]